MLLATFNDTNLLNLQNKVFSTDVLPDNLISSSLSRITHDKKHYYLQFDFSNEKLPHQGFKIHVSCTEQNFQNILNITYQFCIQHQVTFKYISNYRNLLINLSGKNSIWSSGKFITIYPKNIHTFKKIITKLYSLFSLHEIDKGISILSDRRFKDSHLLFYRYGVITGPDTNIYKLNSQDVEYKDYVHSRYRLPNGLIEPFPNNIDDKKKSKFLFKTIIPLKAIHSRASGSTFIALDKTTNQKVILKDSKPGFSEGGISSITSLKQEQKNLKKLSQFKFIPNYITSFREDDDFFLCEQEMTGINIDAFRASGNKNFLNSTKRRKLFKLYKNIIINLISNLNDLHQNNIFLGDLSSTNILIDENTQSSSFIDISQSFNISKNKGKTLFSFRTPGFYDQNICNLTPLEQDNQQLGYVIIAMFCRANMFLLVDKTGKMTFNFFKEYASINKIPRLFIEITNKLIKNSDTDLLKLINSLKHGNDVPFIAKNLFSIQYIKYFESSLQKSVYLSQINKIPFKERVSVSLSSSDDFIFDDKLLSLRIKILQNNNVILTDAVKSKVFTSVNHLYYLLTHKLTSSSIQKLDITKIFSLLLCSISQATSKNEPNIRKLIDTINNLYQYKSSTEGIFYRPNLHSNHLSPYLSNGTAGMLIILLEFKRRFHENIYDDQIHEMVNTLAQNFMPQNASLMRGLSGIIFSLLKYVDICHDKQYINFIKENIETLPYYSYKWNNQDLIVNPSFQNLDISFEDGNKGVIYIINLAKTLHVID